jgi:peptidoglycan/xylan/chitin deacetylase (PgdA/CDA1 family)
LLEKLQDKGVKATFFVIGSRIIERPGVVIEEYMNGHEIGVHTWSHAVGRFFFCLVLTFIDDNTKF